ncbi:MAG TPA: hypothetical protein VMU11_02805 [Verrucomicrobiae bacterium]|nr:hypothetical protein [Verrucomicrobiae bacterium]
MPADYHHLTKVLDMIAALGPNRVLETSDGEGVYAPLIRRYLPDVASIDVAGAEAAHVTRKRFDAVIYPVDGSDHHATLDHVRALLQKHRGVIVIAAKPEWDKADFAALGNALFVNDPALVIAYLGTTPDIKKLRRELLRRRVRRGLTGASRDRRAR